MTQTSTDIGHLIQNIPFFKGLTEEQFTELGKIINICHYQSGNMIFKEGDSAISFYILLEGQVKIYKMSGDGKEVILHLFNDYGSVFADFPFFLDVKTYPAYALCLQPSTLLAIDGNAFSSIIKTRCVVAFNVIEQYAKRLLEFTRLVEDLSLRSIDERLARYILSVSEISSDKAKIPMHKKTLASILGTIPETLSRAFKKLSDEGIIHIEKQDILILKRKALEELADMTTETAV